MSALVVHVHAAPLPASQALLQATDVWQAILATDECARATRIRHPDVAARFIAARLLLRHALAPPLGCPPAAVPIVVDADGRPRVDLPIALPISLSHTRHQVCIAYARPALPPRPEALPAVLGVDIEDTARQVDVHAIARRALQPDEYAAFAALPDVQRADAFWRIWTHKEAVLKAIGARVSGGLTGTRVRMSPPGGLVALPEAAEQGGRWWLGSWAPVPDARAALAVRHDGPLVVHWQRQAMLPGLSG